WASHPWFGGICRGRHLNIVAHESNSSDVLKVGQGLVVVYLSAGLAALGDSKVILSLEHEEVLGKSCPESLLLTFVLGSGGEGIGFRGLVPPPGCVHGLERISDLHADRLYETALLSIQLPTDGKSAAQISFSGAIVPGEAENYTDLPRLVIEAEEAAK